MSFRIPFARPYFPGPTLDRLQAAITARVGSGAGPNGKACEKALSQLFGGVSVLLTTSCTHALEMSSLLLDVDRHCEVIVPTFTFPSTATAFALRGATIRFADCDPATLNLCPESVERLVGPRTRAIVAMHYGGVACDMDRLLALAEHHRSSLIEDNAHGIFGSLRSRPLGTFGSVATQSFHETKNLQCGEGGALVVNDETLLQRAEILREKGTNRSQFHRGLVDKYSWVDHGSSWVLSDLLAAILLTQLEHRQQIQAARHRIWNRYHTELQSWAAAHGVARPSVPGGCEHPAHVYFLVFPTVETTNEAARTLGARGILAVRHYVPLHISTMGRQLGGFAGLCPVAEDISERLLRLPLYADMTESEQDEVIEGLTHHFR